MGNEESKLPAGWHTLCTVIIVSAALIIFGYAMGTTGKSTASTETLTPVKIEYRELTWPEYKARIETEVKQDLGSDFQESTIRFTPKKTPEFPLSGSFLSISFSLRQPRITCNERTQQLWAYL